MKFFVWYGIVKSYLTNFFVLSGYHWDHSDLQAANISPTRVTLPPPPPEIHDGVSLISHDSNMHEAPSINLAALPPIDVITSIDSPGDDPMQSYGGVRGEESVWTIPPRPDQYMLAPRSPEDCDLFDSSQTRPVALRNRYDKKSHAKPVTNGIAHPDDNSDDELNENSQLLQSASVYPQVVTTNARKLPLSDAANNCKSGPDSSLLSPTASSSSAITRNSSGPSKSSSKSCSKMNSYQGTEV